MIRLLDVADALPGAAALRARTFDLLALPADAAVVDVGCGTGRAVAELGERGTRPIGVDFSEEMIALARRRWPDVDFRVGDACALPVPDAAVAGYRADKVFHNLADPARALAEARRVLTPGGRIVLAGQDWDTFVIDADDPALTRTIVHARADLVTNPRAARRYRNLLLEVGFADPTVEVHTGVFTDAMMLPLLSGLADAAHATGAITREQHGAWTADQVRRAQEGRLFLAIPLFIASARRR
ncbi:methyltransferase domain-containing protein [Micromonospora sp. BL4]|uniref:methyltransferase domain-containing protein n=1 Tax=Micromonospora sp. BL4 TaxID=2478710 RepID=UPI000EF5725E|nr:methyltransferase domain-containing protein [Micromonospora sp. BL4]RLP94744.1 methyltransferase domain-containing protein [Micromonospora sp. BL4]